MRWVQVATVLLVACTNGGDDTGDDVVTIDEALDCGTLGPAGGVGAGTELQRLDIDTTAFPDAVCNDGTPAFFYFRPNDGAAHADHWIIQLQGGGGCNSGEDCFERWCSVDTNFGMQGMTATESPENGIGGRGILDRTRPANLAAGFNQVFVRYCSSDMWTGRARDVDVTAPHPVTGEDVSATMYFEGANIVDAVLATLRRDGVGAPTYTIDGGSAEMPDLDDATVLVLAGASGGGAGTIFNGDRVAEDLRATNTGTLEVRLLIDSIFAPSREGLEYDNSELCTEADVCSWEEHMTLERDYVTIGLRAAIEDESCVASHPTDTWKCSDEGHVVRNHVTTPLFMRMGQTDSLIGSNIVEAGYQVDGADLNVDTFAQLVREQLHDLVEPANAEEGDAMTVAPGVYGPTCAKHETLSDAEATFDVTIDVASAPTHMMEAIAAWRLGDAVEVIATDAADNYCPPEN